MRVSVRAAALFLFAVSCSTDVSYRDRLSPYLYEDTKQLVALVESAASLIEQEGEAAFPRFGVAGSQWLNDQFYLFVYELDGTCAFHPVERELVGQNLIGLQDLDGRPVIAMITAVGKRAEADASDWVFYVWEESSKYRVPEWKSSYVRKAVTPGGKVYLVGSGLYNMKMERVFLEDRVNRAADLIAQKGTRAAFEELRNRACPLHILNTYITVTDRRGDIVVDPAFPTLVKKRNLADFRDLTGRNISAEMAAGLKTKDRMWLLYIWPRGEAHRPARHMMYTRKVILDEQEYYVSATYVPASPVWMSD
jgi:hypothetical protein